ncbi:MAG: CBM9 family sugar-binding protein [Cytophagaceae bacterium]|jgi:hypothetical protein|nr:CBM9 family sugar-binding protein [Cytophagaceae bacterium]
MKFSLIPTIVCFTLLSCSLLSAQDGNYQARKASKPLSIDGKASEADWKKARWKAIDQVWLGAAPSASDFQGRYKMLWDKNFLYFFVEIKDDSLSDQRKSPLDNWWEDDCLELFIDENRSKGIHQFTHNAFAYHITLDYDVVDMGTKQQPLLLNDHLIAKWTQVDSVTYTWEVAMKVFNDTYDENSKSNKPVILTPNKVMGFAVSYNDNDGNMRRENFIGSIAVAGEDKNKGWIDAGIFGEVKLVK